MARTTAAKVAAKLVVKKASSAKASSAKAKAPAAKSPAAKKSAKPAGPATAATAVKVARKAARAVAAPVKTTRVKAAPAQVTAPAPARPRLVRDSFTMPEQEYAVLATVKQACLKAGFEVKKSELLRVGVALLGRLDVGDLRAVLASLPQLKTGRPPGE
ncbi:hypothetical protein NX784_14460 [Massilia pinisoli]|uniref:Uncharacterized protein n=1 Tax=Massilia pinisoli TaxID=1772194 RepID=A0ABT1ZS89_9BURK|nr:hypothetical protein [Massilia pinisoli]MCS0582792.1 hypothetical protein [Massilia pinisoli]